MAYLFVHFTGESKDGEQIYFSVSRDAMYWTDLGNGPVLLSSTGEKGVRDPFIVRNCLDDQFYIIATDLRIASGKGWDVAQYEGSTALIMWKSADLIHWSEAERIEMPGMKEAGAGCVWAPETIYDKEKEAYFVYWASMIEKKQRIFAAWTKDFRSYEKVFQYIERKNHVIDTTMAEDEEGYHRFSASEEFGGILLENGKVLASEDFIVCEEACITGTKGTEGPIIIYIRELKKWCLYVDDIANGRGYVPFLADIPGSMDFQEVSAKDYNFGLRKKRHGSIIEINDKEYESLLGFYGKMIMKQEEKHDV